jgi:protein-tyrosine phosphatase
MKRLAECFVCLGNICRSPIAEGVMLELVRRAGLAHVLEVDSAGTGDWHVGAPPDPRAIAAAARRGYDLSALSARQVADADFARFDLILALDHQNLADLQKRCPPAHAHKLVLLMQYGEPGCVPVVADPYFGGPEGFDATLALCEQACAGLLADLRARLDAGAAAPPAPPSA